MSITGQPQEYVTVKSSFEVLDSPVPLRARETSDYSSAPKSLELQVPSQSTNNSMVRKPEYSVDSIEVSTKSQRSVTESVTPKRNLNESSVRVQSDVQTPIQEEGILINRDETLASNKEIEFGESKTVEVNKACGATYVSTQRKEREDIAVAVASEFEEHVRKSYRQTRREETPQINARAVELQNSIIHENTEYSERTTGLDYKEETLLSDASGVNDPDNELVENTNKTDDSLVDKADSDTRSHTHFRASEENLNPSRKQSSVNHQDYYYGHRDIASTSALSEVSSMSTAHYGSNRQAQDKYGAMSRNVNGRDQYNHLDPVRVPNRRERITANGHIYGQYRQYSTRADHKFPDMTDHRHNPSQNPYVENRSPYSHYSSKTPGVNVLTPANQTRYREEVRSTKDDAVKAPLKGQDVDESKQMKHCITQDADHTQVEQRPNTQGPETNEALRSKPDGVDNPQVPLTHDEEEVEIPRQNIPFPTHGGSMVSLQSVPPPNYNQPPTIIQNGVPKEELLEMMNKGLSEFTTEMAIMVIEKLKPEYDALAKQVGETVKEETVSELKDLREKLETAQSEIQELTKERDQLKEENTRERDQMKKEFEKDRLKRVKEFEEKKELIDTLQKEIEQFKGMMKEKDKMFRKAEAKAKAEEQKRIKSEEDSEKKLKEMQKELDKAKGELLVQKSKKRLQISSAKEKKDSLAKLNSHHGVGPRKFNGHKPVEPADYVEGDD